MTLESWTRTRGWQSTFRWKLAQPFRALAAARALPRGRLLSGRMALRIAWQTVQPGSAIFAATPGGCSVEFSAESLLGRVLWTEGAFEKAEVLAAFRLARTGSYSFDVGANVGLFSVAMSRAVGPIGHVVAIEPAAATVAALRSNLSRNGCTNVDVIEGAAAAAPGQIRLTLTDDPALHTAGGQLIRGHSIVQTSMVEAFTLDAIWLAADKPQVSVIKIDVEGSEESVLAGSMQMLESSRPALIIEVDPPERIMKMEKLLKGYRVERSPGFAPWNYLMLPR